MIEIWGQKLAAKVMTSDGTGPSCDQFGQKEAMVLFRFDFISILFHFFFFDLSKF